MTTAAIRRPPWLPVVWTVLAAAFALGTITWRMSLSLIDQQVRRKRSEVKKLALSGGIMPQQEVADYIAQRQAALAIRYDRLLGVVSVPAPAADAADPQLKFQEQFHDIHRTLERLAAARSVPVPEVLGFPKELPPPEAVPRLLVQLEMIRSAAEALFRQEVAEVTSFKIEDPQLVPDDTGAPFLIRVPVRVRLDSSLPQFISVLGALQQTTPVMDIRGVRIGTSDARERLEVECVLARYLANDAPLPTEEAAPSAGKTRARQERRAKTRGTAR